MLVNDTREYIGTVERRLNPTLCESSLNSPNGLWTVSGLFKPVDIPSRGGRIGKMVFAFFHTRYSRLRRNTLC
jgi:hypothetical protein